MIPKTILAALALGAAVAQAQTLTIKEASGWLESAYVKWQATGRVDSFRVYVDNGGKTIQKLDNPLIRSYGSYWRADAVGLKAGSCALRVVAFVDGKEQSAASTGDLEVLAHDRAGFAFAGGRIPGAYQPDGTPMPGSVVVYLTEGTKNSVSLNVTGASSNPCVGIQNILYGFKKGKDTRPLIIRVVGQVAKASVMDGGDLVIENANQATGHITLEGVGDDAVADGWGVRLKSASNIEVRNLGVMNVNSTAGDDIGLQQDNDHVWIHNNDHFYGDAGSDADQVKGDGAMDVKKSTYVTIAYDHFWDNGKSSLLGLSEGTTAGLFIDYHHNWFDHSDSRHPRVRFYSAHVYNNYFDGVSKYGVGSTMGSSIFVEGNFFRHCKYPMLTSLQGTDVWDSARKANVPANGTFSGEAGGTIKAWNNHIEGQKRFVAYGSAENPNSSVDFDAYVASSRSERVPATVKSASGGNTYNNFDTDPSTMYTYTADDPLVARTKVETYAGRIHGGDFKWAFDNSLDDTSSAVNKPLKAAIVGYRTKLVGIQGEGRFQTSSVQKLSDAGSGPIRVDLRVRKLSMEDGLTMRSAQIVGMDGTRAMEWSATTEADFARLRSGIYLVRVRTDRGTFQKLICLEN